MVDGRLLVSRRGRLGLGLVGDMLSDGNVKGSEDGTFDRNAGICPGMVDGNMLCVSKGTAAGCSDLTGDGTNDGYDGSDCQGDGTTEGEENMSKSAKEMFRGTKDSVLVCS